jgi:hypothetical protein
VEFIRVQIDKVSLLALIIWFYETHADERILFALIGGLIMLIQGRRFRQ